MSTRKTDDKSLVIFLKILKRLSQKGSLFFIDTTTLAAHFAQHETSFKKAPDGGYGSEENYNILEHGAVRKLQQQTSF